MATESMRNWLRPVGIEALRGAYDGGSKRNRIDADVPPPGCPAEPSGIPYPGYFAKRGRKWLILKGGCGKKGAKRLQGCDGKGVSLAGRVSCRGNMGNVIIKVYRCQALSSPKTGKEKNITQRHRGRREKPLVRRRGIGRHVLCWLRKATEAQPKIAVPRLGGGALGVQR